MHSGSFIGEEDGSTPLKSNQKGDRQNSYSIFRRLSNLSNSKKNIGADMSAALERVARVTKLNKAFDCLTPPKGGKKGSKSGSPSQSSDSLSQSSPAISGNLSSTWQTQESAAESSTNVSRDDKPRSALKQSQKLRKTVSFDVSPQNESPNNSGRLRERKNSVEQLPAVMSSDERDDEIRQQKVGENRQQFVQENKKKDASIERRTGFVFRQQKSFSDDELNRRVKKGRQQIANKKQHRRRSEGEHILRSKLPKSIMELRPFPIKRDSRELTRDRVRKNVLNGNRPETIFEGDEVDDEQHEVEEKGPQYGKSDNKSFGPYAQQIRQRKRAQERLKSQEQKQNAEQQQTPITYSSSDDEEKKRS